MVAAYWEIGRAIVEQEQQGQQRAEYGKGLLVELSQRLSAEFGRGFDRSNLWHMRSFYLSYPILDAVRRELSWTHYRLLLRVDKPDARAFYEGGKWGQLLTLDILAEFWPSLQSWRTQLSSVKS